MAPFLHDPHFTVTVASGLTCEVDLQVFCRNDNRIVAVVSHHPDENPEQRALVTRAIEAAANKLLSEMGCEFDYLIEHTPLRHRPGARSTSQPQDFIAESFDLIQFQWEPPAHRYHTVATDDSWPWKHLGRRQAEAIIGEPFSLDQSSTPKPESSHAGAAPSPAP